MKEFDEFIQQEENISIQSSKNYNSLVFAFVGDAVFSLFVRDYFVLKSNAKAGVLHKLTSNIVRAKTQSLLLDKLEPILTEEEIFVAKNARNVHTNNVAKNSNLEEYKKSTSFEAVLGFLHITNQRDRLRFLLDICKEEFWWG